MIQIPPKEFIDKFKSIYGAFSVCEMLALYNICLQAPEGYAAELGVYRGKSAMVAALGLQNNILHLVEPEFKDEKWEEEVYSMLLPLNKNVSILTFPDYSTDFIPEIPWLSYCFVDSGDHSDDLPMTEAKLLEDKIIPGGIIAWHDINCQFIRVNEAYNYLLSTGKYEEINIPWDEIKSYVSEHNLEEGNNSWHHPETPLPCFVGALKKNK